MGPMALMVLLAVVAIGGAGCSKTPQLMPTPHLYARGDVNPFADVPPALQNNRVEVLYLTDRVPEGDSPNWPKYGTKRSRSVAVGISEVQFGKDVSWDQLVQASRSAKRQVKLERFVTKTTELVRFPPTPRTLAEPVEPTVLTPSSPALRQELGLAMDKTMQTLSTQLAKTPVKEVYLFVHGYNNQFEDGVMTIAQLWHFFGRQGVPIAYSWPAGSSGLLRGYTTDRESSEFTVYHLKQAMRAIASCPDVNKVHLIAHSRGTDVLATALRELHLEINASGQSTRQVLKLGNLVLAAPDLDFDVVMQRLATARVGRVPEQTALYVCSKDKALGLSSWLFGGLTRLGKLKSNMFTQEEIDGLRATKTMQIIDARVSDAGSHGHNYFHSNPAVSSDLILLVRYHRLPGAENGRPLRVDPDGFWTIDDDYPGPPKPQTSGEGKK